MPYDYDIVIHDTVSAPLEKGVPIGGSERALQLLKEGFERVGLSVYISRRDVGHECMTCRALVISRSSPAPKGIEAKRTVVAATDKEPWLYSHSKEYPIQCVSDWQAQQFRKHGFRIHVIYPIVSEDVFAIRESKIPGRFIYAGAPVKGLIATVQTWCTRPKELVGELVVASTGYGDKDVPQFLEKLRGEKIRWIGSFEPTELARQIAMSERMFTINTYEECLPVTHAIANIHGLEPIVACKGHSVCGIKEAWGMPPQTFRESDVIPKWLEFLGL